MLGDGGGVPARRVHHDDAAFGRGVDVDRVDTRSGPADHFETLARLDGGASDLGGAADDQPFVLADALDQLALAERAGHVDVEPVLAERVDADGLEPVGDQNPLHDFSAKIFWAARTLDPKSTGWPISASTCSSRRERVDDVELGAVAHVAQAEELALHLSLPAGDRDVVAARVRRGDLLAIHAFRRGDRGHRRARRGLGEELEPERLDTGARGAGESIVTLEHVGQPFGLEQPQRFPQSDDDRHRRREAHLVLRHVLQLVREIEVELRQGRALGLPPGLLVERAEPEAGRQHQPLLRTGHHDIDVPGVHRQIGDAETRDRVDDQDRVVLPRDGGVGSDVVQHAGRGLAVLDEHGLHVGVALERLGDAARVDGLPERSAQVDHVEAVRLGEIEPAVAELPGADHHDAITRGQRVDDGGFHRTRARTGERNDLGARLEELLQRGAHFDEERVVLRGAVVDDRLGHREQNLARNWRRPRRHQLILLHADGLLRVVRFDSMVTRPPTPDRPSAVTKIASLRAACGEKNSTT